MKFFKTIPSLLALAAILVNENNAASNPLLQKRALAPLNQNPGSFRVVGNSGIAAMHAVLTAPTKILIIDKVENNPVKQRDGRVAVSVEYDIVTNKFRVLNLSTNTFCSAGSFLGNGTLVHSGGAETITRENYTEGFQSLRLFNPCSNGRCDWFEDSKGLTSKRWYPTMVSLSDGRVLIIGGSKRPISVANEKDDNPTVEFFPRPPNSPPIPLPFLSETLPFNLYPFAYVLPGPATQTRLFIFSNTDSIVWDWTTFQIVKRLPRLPGPPRLYPLAGGSVMLPLRPENNYAPQVLVCGGTAKKDKNQLADNSCGRINLSNLDTAKWEMSEFGGIRRHMPDSIILADGKVLFLNGAGKGFSGYNSGTNIVADNPVFTPLLYDDLVKNKTLRFTRLTNSKIARLYHSVATLVPDGRVFVTGSNPTSSVTNANSGVKFTTEFRVEMFTPPYLQLGIARPVITSVNGATRLNQGAIKVNYNTFVPVVLNSTDTTSKFTAALVNHGFSTHSNHMSQRYVVCRVLNPVARGNGVFTMQVEMPPNSNIVTPGRNYLYILNKKVPAKTAIEVMIS